MHASGSQEGESSGTNLGKSRHQSSQRDQRVILTENGVLLFASVMSAASESEKASVDDVRSALISAPHDGHASPYGALVRNKGVAC